MTVSLVDLPVRQGDVAQKWDGPTIYGQALMATRCVSSSGLLWILKTHSCDQSCCPIVSVNYQHGWQPPEPNSFCFGFPEYAVSMFFFRWSHCFWKQSLHNSSSVHSSWHPVSTPERTQPILTTLYHSQHEESSYA
jgi:hypothetical protein